MRWAAVLMDDQQEDPEETLRLIHELTDQIVPLIRRSKDPEMTWGYAWQATLTRLLRERKVLQGTLPELRLVG